MKNSRKILKLINNSGKIQERDKNLEKNSKIFLELEENLE